MDLELGCHGAQSRGEGDGAHARTGRAPVAMGAKGRRGGEVACGRRERAGAAIYRAKLWTCQTVTTGGR
jgi:hypothetical protein